MSVPECPHCGQPLTGWTPPPVPPPPPPPEPGYAENHPQRDHGHVSGRAKPAFAPGWFSQRTTSDADGKGLLRGTMGSFRVAEPADAPDDATGSHGS